MRLRRKPWIDEAIKDYTDILYMEEPTRLKGNSCRIRYRKGTVYFPHGKRSS